MGATDNCKAVIISSDDIYFIGDINGDKLHIECLLEYGDKKYSNGNYINQLTYKHHPHVAAYFLTLEGNVVFLNTTTKERGKRGLLMLPDIDEFNDVRAKLYDFSSAISDYKISIAYKLYMEDGFLMGSELVREKEETPKELLDLVFVKQKKR